MALKQSLLPGRASILAAEVVGRLIVGASDFARQMEELYRGGTAPWDTGLPCSELMRRLGAGELPSSGKALDLGCGSGIQTLLLAEHGLETVGVDLSPTAIERAVKRASDHPAGGRARFFAGDLTEIRDIGEPFDVLLDRGCYHLARRQDLAAFLSALKDFSHPGSQMFLLAFSAAEPQEFPELPVVVEEEIREELGGLFDLTDLRTCRLDRPQGFEREPLFWSALLERR